MPTRILRSRSISTTAVAAPVWLLRLAVAHEFDADIKSLSPHVADAIVALGDGSELSQEVSADLECVLFQILGLERLQDGESRRGRDRVSSKRVEVARSFPEGLERSGFTAIPAIG